MNLPPIIKFFILLWLFIIVSCVGQSGFMGDPSVGTGSISDPNPNETRVEHFHFILGPMDVISINVWRNDDLKRTLTIDPSGNIQYPLIGEIKASGLTIAELKEQMTASLSRYIVDPQLDIMVSNAVNLKIHILGEVNAPGTFQWQAGMRAWEGIAKAGGFNRDADRKNILLIRSENGRAVMKTFDMKVGRRGNDPGPIAYLKNNDIVYVLPTTIADVQRFMNRLTSILSPVINIESGIVLYPQVKDVLRGKETSGTIVVPR